MMWQVVEKTDFGTDWQLVRYDAYAMERFDTEAEASEAAKKYLTDVNCNNSLAKDEKRNGSEAFMMMKTADEDVKHCFMGVLDGEDWFLTNRKGEVVTDSKYYELEGKSEVAVREVRGT